MQGTASISGLISGMKTDDLLAKIMEIERRPIQRYQARQQTLRSQITAYQEANTRLLAVKDAASQLALGAFFESRTASSSNTDRATVSAQTGATPGEYTLCIEAMARAHQKLSQSYADHDTTRLGTGTLTFTAGGKSTAVTVTSANNTLSGIRDAINNANGNIRASIVQDGTASYRLMISSKETGTANTHTISGTLTGGSAPVFSDLQAAQDSRVNLGSGPGAITVTRSSNSVIDVIPGVTLNIASASPGQPFTVSVKTDNDKIEETVRKFVDQFNAAVDYFNQQFKFDPASLKGGELLGDFALRQIQSDLMRVVTGSVQGVTKGNLAEIGVTMGGDGRLSLNPLTLEDKLAADPTLVKRTLALTATTTDTSVQLVSVTSKTKADGTPYAVSITQAARQARVTSGGQQTAALDADETLTLNGISIALTTGMTQAQVLAAINARSSETGVKASATLADGTGSGAYVTLLSTGYGATAAISVVSNRSNASGVTSGIGNVTATQASPGGQGGAGSGEAGLDVAGTINGEPATGAGRLLTGNTGNANTEGLKITISAAAAGALGTIQVFKGIAKELEQTLDANTNQIDGRLKSEENGVQQRIDDLQALITQREEAITRREEQIRRQFNAMEEAMARYQNQSSFMAAQLGGGR